MRAGGQVGGNHVRNDMMGGHFKQMRKSGDQE